MGDIPYSCHYAGTRKFKDETLKHEFGIEVECKCANHEELCRCNKVEEGYSHEDMSWCADWFNPHDFEEDRDDDHDDHDDEHHHDDHHDHHDDDHHHDDHHHDDHHDDHHHHHDDDDQHHGDRDVPVFEFDVKKDAVKKNAALAKFDSLKGKAKEASARFLHNKLAEQQK